MLLLAIDDNIAVLRFPKIVKKKLELSMQRFNVKTEYKFAGNGFLKNEKCAL